MEKNYDERLFGRWNFDALITLGPHYGTLYDGYFLLKHSDNIIAGKLYLPARPTSSISVQVDGSMVTLYIKRENITAEGWFRGPNRLTGTFTRANSESGQWVATRGEESIPQLKGVYNFEAVLTKGPDKGSRLDGILQLNQSEIEHPKLGGVSTMLTGSLQLNQNKTSLKVSGAANGGEIYLVIEKDGHPIMGLNTVITKTHLEGTFFGPYRTELGWFRATLKPTRFRLDRVLELKAQIEVGPGKGTTMEGRLELSQSPIGKLTGTFILKGKHQAQKVTGKLSLQGSISFKIGSLNFSGQVEPINNQAASGIFVNTAKPAYGIWAIR
ncbi:MAG: hypothetical protein JWP00_1689 [Chloroflexi bacterium]|jgi:hypothetical protein|nr:hypothetical protein [Chloroflexota bacterium]